VGYTWGDELVYGYLDLGPLVDDGILPVNPPKEVMPPPAVSEGPADEEDVNEPFASDPDPGAVHDRGGPPIAAAQPPVLPSDGRVTMGFRPSYSQPDQFAGETVIRRLRRMTGVDTPQKALLALRRGLFKNIVPRVTRDESREKKLNVATIEQFRDSILALLESPEAIAEVLVVVLNEMRRPAHREEVLMHKHGIA
jgi:hypothetical protein